MAKITYHAPSLNMIRHKSHVIPYDKKNLKNLISARCGLITVRADGRYSTVTTGQF